MPRPTLDHTHSKTRQNGTCVIGAHTMLTIGNCKEIWIEFAWLACVSFTRSSLAKHKIRIAKHTHIPDRSGKPKKGYCVHFLPRADLILPRITRLWQPPQPPPAVRLPLSTELDSKLTYRLFPQDVRRLFYRLQHASLFPLSAVLGRKLRSRLTLDRICMRSDAVLKRLG